MYRQQAFVEQEREKNQLLKNEDKIVHRNEAQQRAWEEEQQETATHVPSVDPFDAAFSQKNDKDWFEKLFTEVGSGAFNQYKDVAWQTPLNNLAKQMVGHLEDPLVIEDNDKLENLLESHPGLREKMSKMWEDTRQNMEAGLCTRAALEDVCKVVPQFQNMSREEAAEAFARTQALNSAAIPAANYTQFFMAVDRELKLLNPKSSLQEIFGKSAVKLGVECAEHELGPEGKLKDYHGKLQDFGHDFSAHLDNHIKNKVADQKQELDVEPENAATYSNRRP